MKKRLLSLLLVVGMLIGMQSICMAEEYTFADDDGTGTWSWASDYIYDCYDTGIINGYTDGTYLPDNELTRAEAAKIIALTFGLSSAATESTFSDVADSHWALQYIEACVDAGIINGYTDGTFMPGQNVTRAEMAKMIASALALNSDASVSSFSDVGTHWALTYIEACAEAGVINGYSDGTFLPGNNITRAEAATIISRALDLMEKTAGNSDADEGNSTNTDTGSTEADTDTDGNGDDDSEDESGLITIEAEYGSLYYPAEWEDVLEITETLTNEIDTVIFAATADGQEYILFIVMICDAEGDSVGAVTDDAGQTRNVFVDISELPDLSDLSEEEQDQLYAMQEAVNILIENLQ